MTYNLNDFNGDFAARLRAAGDALRENAGSTLVIPSGEYVLNNSRAAEIRDDIYAGRYGRSPQTVMFSRDFSAPVGLDLTGCRDVTVEAEGAKMILSGFMEPVRIMNASGVTLRGLTIDHDRKPFCRALISEIGDGSAVLDFDPATPPAYEMSAPRSKVFDLVNGRLTSAEHPWDSPREFITPLKVRLSGYFNEWELGQEIYFFNTFHARPAILISHSESTLLENITVHSQPGMGIVGFKSRDITMRHLRVVPSEGYNISTNTDATHFACCSGTVTVEDSEFSGHGDDAINVHSYYYGISSCEGEYCTLATVTPDGTHSAEPDFPEAGAVLVLTDINTLEEKETYRVIESSRGEPCRVRLDKAAPDGSRYLFGNLTDVARLIFRRNKTANHLARSVLCKTRCGLIEDNEFYGVTGTAVNISAEMNFGEGIPVNGVTIRGNRFVSCGEWGHGTIWNAAAVAMNAICPDGTARGVHRNILIENNTVIRSSDTVHFAFAVHNTKDAVIRGNRLIGFDEDAIDVNCSENITLENNTVEKNDALVDRKA